MAFTGVSPLILPSSQGATIQGVATKVRKKLSAKKVAKPTKVSQR